MKNRISSFYMEKDLFEKNIAALKEAQLRLAASSESVRNEALKSVYDALEEKKDFIFAENGKDLESAKNNVSDAVMGRLKFDEKKLDSVRKGILDIISLPDPIVRIEEKRELDEAFILTRKSVPIGVIGMIFEARPDALVQIVSLCIKSGNAIVLKGGKEAMNSNRALFKVIADALDDTPLTSSSLMLIESHEDVASILKMDKYIDLIIPRGSNAFVRYVMDNTRIPVLGHADGICSIYVDESADMDIAIPVVLDSKVQYPAACNAVEMILVNEKVKDTFLPKIKKVFDERGVIIHGDDEVRGVIECESLGSDDLFKEFLSLEVSIKCVNSINEAISLINSYGSHHTDAIISEDEKSKNLFFTLVDSADVFANCSTRFADGYRFGLGAEVGISTSKIHARGPVGLSGLMSYKWILSGHGEIVADYASGRRFFHHKDLI